MFSFRSSRVLADGEGGVVVTNDRQVSLALRSLRDHNSAGNAGAKASGRNGDNDRFPEISALLGLAQYRSLPELIAARNDIAAYYRARLRHEAPKVSLQAHPESVSHAYYEFMLNLPVGVSREHVRLFLQRQRVPVKVCCALASGGRPVSGGSTETESTDCPVAAEVAARSLWLPTHPGISERQRRHIVDVLLDAIQQAVEPPAS